jgi:hypothetical protein
MVSNSGDSSASGAQVLSSQTTIQNSLGRSNCLQDISLASHCLETSLVYSPILPSLYSNGYTCYILYIYTHIYTGVGQNNWSTTDTIHISLLIWCSTTFCLQYSCNPWSGLFTTLNSL